MKLFKKISIVILSIIAMFSFSMFFACDCGGSNSNQGSTPPPAPQVEIIEFNKEQLDLVVGDEEYVLAKANSFAGIILTYSSSNESVASVDKYGKVTAHSKGEAIIYASYADMKGECKVNVTHGNYLPSLVINNLSNDRVIVPQGVDYQIDNYILFNSKKFTNASYNYQTSNGNVRVDENGVIKGLSLGETKVTVTASWDGFSGIASLTKTFTVKVTPFVQLLINGGATSKVTLFNKPLETLNGTTPIESDFVVTALGEKGQELEYSVELVNSDDAKYVEYDETEQKLVAKGLLTPAPVTVKVSVSVSETENYELFVEVECVRALGDYMNAEKTAYEVVDFNTLTGIIDLEAIFGFETELELAKLGREELIIDGNRIVGGIEGDAFSEEPEHVVITIYDEQQGYNVEIIPYVYKDATVYADDYHLSADTGEFFDADFKLKTVEDIFGANNVYKEAYLKTADGQERLPLSNAFDAVLGVDAGSSPKEVTLAIANDSEMFYLDVTAYTLIIDEMQDFDYFFVKDGTWSYDRQTRWSITSGMDWDGYYVLANNIDATDYHVLDEKGNPTEELGQFKGLQNPFPHINWNDVLSNATFAAMGATRAEADMAKYGIAGKGMMGTFDGRGYIIDKYTPSSGGLFQYVNGGLIKDVGFTNVGCSGGGYGVLGDMILNGAQLDGIYAQLVPNAYKGSSASLLSAGITNTCKVKNVMMIAEDPGTVSRYRGFIAQSSYSYSSDYSNVFLVSNVPFNSSTVNDTVIDSEYVDGQISTAYTSKLNGSRRYTSLQKMAQDKDAFASKLAFNTEYWTYLDGAIPVLKKAMQVSQFSIYAGDYEANEKGSFVEKGKSITISARYLGIYYENASKVELVDGGSYVSVDGATLTANEIGVATLRATYNFKGETLVKEFKIIVVPKLEEYDAKTYYFSSVTGEFFEQDNSGKLVKVDGVLTEVFGSATSYNDLFAVYDANGVQVEVDTDKQTLVGLKGDKSGFVDTYVDLYTTTKGMRVELRLATLIIDEAQDLDYFTLTGEFDRSVTAKYVWTFTEGDFDWDGYYVLAGNVDASEYGIHDIEKDLAHAKSSPRHLRHAAAATSDRSYSNGINSGGHSKGGYFKGFTGTLDGQGYIISNLTTTSTGLLGIIGDATIQNIGLVNCGVENNEGGFLAWSLGGHTLLKNVYVETNFDPIGVTANGNATAGYTPIAATVGINTTSENVIVLDNTALRNDVQNSAYNYGSFTTSSVRESSQPVTFNKAFNNYIIVSNKPLMASLEKGVVGNSAPQVVFEAEFVDGVEYANKDIIAQGIRRYNDLNKLIADKDNLNFADWDSKYWTVGENGVVEFNSRANVKITSILIDGEIVGKEIPALVGATIAPKFEVNGVETEIDSISIVSGNASVVGKTLKLGADEGVVVINIVKDDIVKQLTINVGKPSILFGGEVLSETVNAEMILAETKTVELTFNGKAVTDFTVETAETTDIVSVNGKNIVASSSKAGVIEIKVTINGVELVFELTVRSPDVYANGVNITNNSIMLEVGEQKTVAIYKDGVQMDGEISITANNTLVTVDGAVITAGNTAGESQLDVTLNGMEFTVDVIILDSAEVLDIEPYFSAHDGLLFNSDMTALLDSEALFGDANAKLLSAKDSEKSYQVVDGKIFGLEVGKSLKEVQLTLYSDVKAVKVNVKAATLIIDEASDLSYFSINGHGTIANDELTYDGDDFVWDGYYVLAKDIDAHAEGYLHHFNSNADFNPAGLTMEAVAKTNYGLSGVFDGQGHTISNLYIATFAGNPGVSGNAGTGLFIYINGGTVKNLATSNIYSHYNGSAGAIPQHGGKTGHTTTSQFATYLVNGAKVEDSYLGLGRPSAYAARLLYKNADSSSSFNNVIIDATSYSSFNVGGGGLYNESSATMNDVYFIGKHPVSTAGRNNKKAVIETIADGTTIAQEWIKAAVVASSIDGVAQSGTINYVYKGGESAVRYDFDTYNVYDATAVTEDTLPLTPYTVKVASGIKQYTTMDNFKADTNNDFTNWNPDVWEIIAGIPTFVTKVSEYTAHIGDAEASTSDYEMVVGDEFDVTVKADDKAILGKPTVVIESGEEFVTVEGTKIKAVKPNEGEVIKIKITYRDNVWTQTFNVYNDITPEQYDTELYFSAHDGQFFNGDKIVSVSDILDGEIAKVVGADGAGLTYQDGKVLGLNPESNTDWSQTSITLYTTDKAVKVTVKAADLIIDDATDLAYFQIKSADGFLGTDNSSTNYRFAEGEIEFDGYYVLAKNIDASTYYHDFVNGSAFYATSARGLNRVIDNLAGKGLTGTFDGQGYAINDINYNSTTANNVGGLFGFINGGTVKNLSIVRPNIESGVDTLASGSASLADSIMNGAKIEDCYFYFDQEISYKSNHFISANITADTVMSRIFIVVEGDVVGGKFNANTTHAMFCGYTGMTDTYVVNKYLIDMGEYDKKATVLSIDAEEGATPSTVRLNKAFSDAAYVDGVANTSTMTTFYVKGRPDSGNYNTSTYTITYNGETFDASNPSYEITLLNGVKRYTNLDKMKADAAKNDFSAWTNWTVTDGIPSLKTK